MPGEVYTRRPQGDQTATAHARTSLMLSGPASLTQPLHCCPPCTDVPQPLAPTSVNLGLVILRLCASQPLATPHRHTDLYTAIPMHTPWPLALVYIMACASTCTPMLSPVRHSPPHSHLCVAAPLAVTCDATAPLCCHLRSTVPCAIISASQPPTLSPMTPSTTAAATYHHHFPSANHYSSHAQPSPTHRRSCSHKYAAIPPDIAGHIHAHTPRQPTVFVFVCVIRGCVGVHV